MERIYYALLMVRETVYILLGILIAATCLYNLVHQLFRNLA